MAELNKVYPCAKKEVMTPFKVTPKSLFKKLVFLVLSRYILYNIIEVFFQDGKYQ